MRYVVTILTFIVLGGCNFPEDPNKSLENIKSSHQVHVGICDSDLNLINIKEKKLLESLGTELNAKIIWSKSTQEKLYEKLERNELNLVACTINEESPWKDRLSFTVPFDTNSDANKSYVFAVPQGENAWLHYINQFINRLRKNEAHK